MIPFLEQYESHKCSAYASHIIHRILVAK